MYIHAHHTPYLHTHTLRPIHCCDSILPGSQMRDDTAHIDVGHVCKTPLKSNTCHKLATGVCKKGLGAHQLGSGPVTESKRLPGHSLVLAQLSYHTPLHLAHGTAILSYKCFRFNISLLDLENCKKLQ